MSGALLQDFRYALRHLRRAPGFSLVVILTLSLGVGANTALFSLLNGLVLRPLPVKEPQSLVALSRVNQRGRVRWMPLTTVAELARQQRVFEALCGYAGGGIFTTDAKGVLSASSVEFVTGQYYTTLGVRPFLGRLISDDDVPLAGDPAPVVVLGYRFWRRQFGGDLRALGQTLGVDGVPLTIVGVTPPGFSGLQVDIAPDITVPITLLPGLGSRATDPKPPPTANYVIGRLRPGVTLAQARAQIGALWPSIQAATVPPGLSPGQQDEVRSLRVQIEPIETGFSFLRNRYAKPLYLLVGFTGLLLVLACVNLSGLLLARAAAREHELAVRVALGASRGRLAQQLLAEGLLVSAAGTAVALPLTWWASQALGAMLWTGLVPLTLQWTPDWRVLSVMMAVALGAGLVLGVMPAWAASRRRAHVGLQQARTIAHATGRWGKTLLVAQVALSLILLFGAGLLTRSLAKLRAVDPGFRADGVLVVRLNPQPSGYRDIDDAAYYTELVGRLSVLPGVQSVSLSRLFPDVINEASLLQSVAPTEGMNGEAEVLAAVDVVSPRFFDTAGIPLVQGRDFTWRDDTHSPDVAIINASLARRLFASGAVIGRRIRIGTDPKLRALEIVGIVGDASLGNLRASHLPVVFRSWLQGGAYARYPAVEIRTGVEPMGLGDAARRTVTSLGREFVLNVRTLEGQMRRSLERERVAATLSSLFAGLAVLLAFIGLYGLLAYSVTLRTREIGVRMALGASRRAVMRKVISEGLAVTLLGVALGVPCALGVGRLTGSLLFGLAPADPVTLCGAVGFLVVVGAVAGLVPAHRASRIDPMAALRCE